MLSSCLLVCMFVWGVGGLGFFFMYIFSSVQQQYGLIVGHWLWGTMGASRVLLWPWVVMY